MKWFRVWVDILDDVKILQLSDYEFKIWIQLMAYASEVNSMSGQCQLNVKSMSLRFRTQVNHLSHAIETFQKLNMVSIDDDGFINITNWKKRQFKSDNAYERVKKFREVKQKRNVSVTELKRPQIQITDTDTEKDKNLYVEGEDPLRLSKYLFDAMKMNNPKVKEPNFQFWAKQIDLMLRVDKREPEDIQSVIDWCQDDELNGWEWSRNILSTKKLRDKFDQLYGKMIAKPKSKGGMENVVSRMLKKYDENGNLLQGQH